MKLTQVQLDALDVVLEMARERLDIGRDAAVEAGVAARLRLMESQAAQQKAIDVVDLLIIDNSEGEAT